MGRRNRHDASILRMRRMKRRLAALILPGLFAFVAHPSVTAAPLCTNGNGDYLQVLGSGGPLADDARASTAYLIWVDNRSKVLVDIGGGASVRFGESGANFADLDHVAISHFHTDHSSDLVTLLKTGVLTGRPSELGISGPGAGGPFPDLESWLQSLIGEGSAYGYLASYLRGDNGRLVPTTVDPETADSVGIEVAAADISMTARGVPHGIVPAIAYRVTVKDRDIVFASDQNGNDESFIEFARGADILVMHLVVAEGVEGSARALHAPPSRIGEIAERAGAGSLVLSHLTRWSRPETEANLRNVRSAYSGNITLAEDLMCIALD